jgi:hypothetical protein
MQDGIAPLYQPIENREFAVRGGGAVIMEDITEIEVHVAKPKSASVVAEVSWTTWRPRGVVVGVVMMRFVC